MEREGVKSPALVTRVFDVGQMACSECLLQHLKGLLPLEPAEVVVAGVEDSRVWCKFNGSTPVCKAVSSRTPQTLEIPSTSLPWSGTGVEKL